MSRRKQREGGLGNGTCMVMRPSTLPHAESFPPPPPPSSSPIRVGAARQTLAPTAGTPSTLATAPARPASADASRPSRAVPPSPPPLTPHSSGSLPHPSRSPRPGPTPSHSQIRRETSKAVSCVGREYGGVIGREMRALFNSNVSSAPQEPLPGSCCWDPVVNINRDPRW